MKKEENKNKAEESKKGTAENGEVKQVLNTDIYAEYDYDGRIEKQTQLFSRQNKTENI
jgi:hypothetical protein